MRFPVAAAVIAGLVSACGAGAAPSPAEPLPPPAAEPAPDDGVHEEGAPDGILGGIVEGVPLPPSPEPEFIAPRAVEAMRISGESLVAPDDAIKRRLIADGIGKLTAVYKFCLDTAGAVESVIALKATGYPAYDDALMATIHSWKYTPFSVDGRAARICSSITFIYTQRPPTNDTEAAPPLAHDD